MKRDLAIVKNVAKLQILFNNLKTADQSIPRMGLVHGFTGYGKTIAIEYLALQTKAVFVRATSLWTQRTLLATLMQELGVEPLSRSDKMFRYITETLTTENRPLFVDEVNYLVEDNKRMSMLDLLRDLHDMSQVPVLLVGHQGTERRVVHRPQLSRRLSQIVEFAPLDVEDTVTLAKTLCAVNIAEAILQRLNHEAEGNAGLITLGLNTVEAYGLSNRLETVTLEKWGKREFGFIKKKNGNGNH